MNHGDFQKTNVAEEVYTRDSVGYQVVVNTSPSPHHSGIVVFYCKAEHFNLEVIRLHVPNVFRFHLVLGGQRWHVVE